MYPAETYSIALGYFPQLLGFVYLLAFGSLLVQVQGLYSSQGILPIHDFVADVRRKARSRALLRFPSIFWINASDTFITASSMLGVCLSIYLLVGLPPLPALILLWLIYLSFASLGQEFLSFQWDALLLEIGFMTIFLPLATLTSPVVCLAFQFFLFRFMFSAGMVKLTSHDSNWRNLRAMCFHYETQPIPNRISWYVHQLPAGFQKLSTLGTFLFELIVPFLALGPAPFKLACFCLLAFFQGLIILTGNYGFFNVLTILLAVPLLADRYLAFLGLSLPQSANMPYLGIMSGAVFGIFILLNILQIVRLFLRPYWMTRILAWCGRWQLSNPYGLFAIMTTDRYEFIIEGSSDLKVWLPYEFRWKPGDPACPPRQAAPHQPRLDWQMWFAALNPAYVDAWLSRLVQRLLEGAPAVLRLFRTIPFTPAPPDYIRLVVFHYHFTDPTTKRTSGRWWNRTEVGRSEPMTSKR